MNKLMNKLKDAFLNIIYYKRNRLRKIQLRFDYKILTTVFPGEIKKNIWPPKETDADLPTL